MKKERIAVAMSGGVDSSVAATLLKDSGHEVIGLTMCFNLVDSQQKRPACCGLQGIEDARRVAHKLDIKHYVLNMQAALEKYVIKNFREEYLRGKTPNPCIRCNQYLKFDFLLKKALSLDARFLATGHYARIKKSAVGSQQSAVYSLKKGRDKFKDQSYFLYRLNQYQLKHALFPLGNYTKGAVRELARKFGLSVAEKNASQEVCFLSGTDYREFLRHGLTRIFKTRINTDIKPGQIVDKKGAVLGEHQGIAFYTIGQREGLGIAMGYPAYITEIDAKHNKITIGKKEDVLKSDLLVKEPHFILNAPKKKIAVKVKIRYNHLEAFAQISPYESNSRAKEPDKNKIRIHFETPQFAITPGQGAVFYDKDTVLGGGIIEKILE